eukprot:jgi/Galph1/4402/GphlegSOOS_G3119.1
MSSNVKSQDGDIYVSNDKVGEETYQVKRYWEGASASQNGIHSHRDNLSLPLICETNENGGKAETVSYAATKVIGSGSFGVVFQATVGETGEFVAIKKVFQDKRFKNRELQIMRMLEHPNIVQLKHCFYSAGEKPDDVYLNLVLEYIPETVYKVTRHYSKLKQPVPMLYVKLYMYQLLRALAYIHSRGVCHRDIKPQNLLVDTQTQVLKLCDFGSAKILVKDEPNISYICSRYYRAPELIFGAVDYTTAVDIWSAGCVMGELLLGRPLFPGESGVDQLVEIIKSCSWERVFRLHSNIPSAIDLISKLLQYLPERRLKPMESLAHPFFDELRKPDVVLPNGRSLPPLFNFDEDEFRRAGALSSAILPHDIYQELASKYKTQGNMMNTNHAAE